jgi:hypothetical protein
MKILKFNEAIENPKPGDYVIISLNINNKDDDKLKNFIDNNIGQIITDEEFSRLIKYYNKPEPDELRKTKFNTVFDKYYIWIGKASPIIAFGKTPEDTTANKYNL